MFGRTWCLDAAPTHASRSYAPRPHLSLAPSPVFGRRTRALAPTRETQVPITCLALAALCHGGICQPQAFAQ
jgi:hypothetical protein